VIRQLTVSAIAVAVASGAAAEPPRYFGFTWVHGRTAAAVPYEFANLDVRAVYVSDPAGDAAAESRRLYAAFGVGSILGFNDFLFGEDNTSAATRPDAVRLFDAWWDAAENRTAVAPPQVVAVWPADSALLRCGGAPDVAACLAPYFEFVGHIRDRLAGTGVVLVDSFDAASVASGLLEREADDLLAAGIRWFGYHQYDVLHPLADPVYQANVGRVRALEMGFESRGFAAEFVLVGDAFDDAAHAKASGGSFVRWDWGDHRTVVDEDFQVACRSGAVALILFNWPDYSWLAERGVTGSVGFGEPAACWEACLGRFVKFSESVCTLCGEPMVVRSDGPLTARRRLVRR